jgi:flagellin
MRVQHNIIAMNSYRNYNNNTKQINKNLEKLSSGYKINRAGDDAAGLAISEKMRAQITGLEGAQKNAKDGISLVQTAEGALTEVHSMLNRMYSLAEQSANGTYDNTTDRAQLQKEVDSLRTEINRIADSSNFNGLNLLDGSLSGKAQVGNLAVTESVAIKGVYTTPAIKAPNDMAASNPADTDFSNLTEADIGKSMDYTVTWKTAKGETKTTTVSMTFQGDGTGIVNGTKNKNYFTDVNGIKYNLDANGKLSADQVAKAVEAGLQKNEEFTAAFEIERDDTVAAAQTFTFTAKVAGSGGASVVGIGLSENFESLDKVGAWDTGAEGAVTVDEIAFDSMQRFNIKDMSVAEKSDTLEEMQSKIFEIDGHKFLLYSTDDTAGTNLSDAQIKALKDSGIEGLVGVQNNNSSPYAANNPVALDDTDSALLAREITRVTGMSTAVGSDLSAADGSGASGQDAKIENDDILFTSDRLRLSGSALTLQIGDTAASYNKLDIQIGDIHASSLGDDKVKLDAIDISKQDGAQKAMDSIKAAINTVSDIRGTLGATQNRLEHTINNLSVMQENIQDAESTIRDTDVADEMMKYTKNSILVQSAQAMLAQANQQPQGVLQLLQ